MNEVAFTDFKKSDLRAAKILEVSEIPGADRLWHLTIDLGEAESRQLVAGIKAQYTREELLGKTIIVVANLEPRAIRGVESRGMLLAAKSGDTLSLLTLDKPLAAGSPIG